MFSLRAAVVTKRRIATWGAAAVLVGGASAAVVLASTGGSEELRISALDGPPAALGQGPLPTDTGLGLIPNLAEARLVYNRGGEQVFIAPGTNGQTCLISASTEGIGTTCAIPGTTPLGPVVGLGAPRADGSVRIRAIVPDGYLTARVGTSDIAIENNVLVFTLARGQESVEISGPAGRSAIPFGQLRSSTSG